IIFLRGGAVILAVPESSSTRAILRRLDEPDRPRELVPSGHRGDKRSAAPPPGGFRAESPFSRREPGGSARGCRGLLAELHRLPAVPRSHAPRGNAVFDAPRRVFGGAHPEGRRASRTAFPRGTVGTR